MANYIMELREVLGARPLILAGSLVILVNSEGKLLFQRRGDNGHWGFPGGCMELGESFEETARREVLEETGLKVGELILLGLDSGKETFSVYPNGHQTYSAFAVYKSNDFIGELQADNQESLELKFFSLNKLPLIISPLDKKLIEKYFSC